MIQILANICRGSVPVAGFVRRFVFPSGNRSRKAESCNKTSSNNGEERGIGKPHGESVEFELRFYALMWMNDNFVVSRWGRDEVGARSKRMKENRGFYSISSDSSLLHYSYSLRPKAANQARLQSALRTIFSTLQADFVRLIWSVNETIPTMKRSKQRDQQKWDNENKNSSTR